MSLVGLAHVCSHLQNCSKARLGLTSIPSTNLLLGLSLQLQQAGFISSVTRGGPNPPILLTATSLPHASNQSDISEATVTQANIASRRLWLGLKYHRDEPVLRKIVMESRPRQRKWVSYRHLEHIVRGREARWTKGLTKTGECLFLTTDRGIMEARECVERKIGGMLLCRAV